MELLMGIAVEDLLELAAQIAVPLFGDYIEIAKQMRDRKKEKDDLFKVIEKTKLAGNLTESMYAKLENASDGNPLLEFDLISTAVKSNKWFNYAVWCMTAEDSVCLKVKSSVAEFVNAIAEFAGYGRIYECYGTVDLMDYAIENEDRTPGTEFIISMDDIKEKLLENEMFRNAMLMKKAKKDADKIKLLGTSNNFFGVSGGRLDQDGLIHPIFFGNTPIITDIGPKQGTGIDDNLLRRLEKALGNLINDQKYAYNIDPNTGLPILIIERDNSYGATESFMIDDGRIMGGSTISILGSYLTEMGTMDYIFVDTKLCPDIAYSILNRSFYQMTAEEVQRAFSCMMQYYSIYNAIDMSNTPWYDYLTFEEKTVLTGRLRAIVEFMAADENLVYLPRLRFTTYSNPDNFTLVSDEHVISPLMTTGFTSPEKCPGLSFTCADGIITQYFSKVPNAAYSM